MNSLGSRDRILITGASRGIGAGTAVALSKAGFDLVLWSRNESDLSETVTKCRGLGADVRSATVDVADSGSVMGAGATSLEGLEDLRGCVLNAGMGIWGNIWELSVEEWREVMSTNLDGAFFTLKVCLPLIERHRHGQIVAMGSDSGFYAHLKRAAYCASKWGLNGLVEAARRDSRAQGIRTTLLVMSRVDTHFRGKNPGDRPSGLSIAEVADAVCWIFKVPPRVEVRELHLCSITDSFGVFPECSGV